MSDTNGNGNGHGGFARIEKLLAHHEAAASALRTTLALLRGDAATTKVATGGDVLAQALRIDEQRRTGRPPAGSKYVGATHAQRQRTAAVLALFDRDEPRHPPEVGHIGSYVKTGYLMKKGDGYVRTTKPYVVSPYGALMQAAATKSSTPVVSQAAAQRAKSAALLATYDRTTPKPGTRGVVMYLRRGYLAKKGDGYVRTAKEFTV